MAEITRRPRWEGLAKDLLLMVFSKLSVEDLYAAFFVCSSWRSASTEPSLWRTLDFRHWDSSPSVGPLRLAFPRLLRFAVDRTDGCLERIYFPDFADETHLLFVAKRCPTLCYLSINNGEICTGKFCVAVANLKFITGIAIHENLVCNDVFHQLSLSCANFHELKVFAKDMDIRRATVICEYLPSLKKLELNDCSIAKIALGFFLDELKALEFLDISGCGRVGITAAILVNASRLKVFNWGSTIDEGEFSNCLDSDNNGDDPCQFDVQFMEWLLRSVGVGC